MKKDNSERIDLCNNTGVIIMTITLSVNISFSFNLLIHGSTVTNNVLPAQQSGLARGIFFN